MPNLRISTEYLFVNEWLIAKYLSFLLRKINLRISPNTAQPNCELKIVNCELKSLSCCAIITPFSLSLQLLNNKT